MKPQTAAVLKHLQQHGSITNVEANAVHKIRSVSSRITELAQLGYVISKARKVDATDQPYVRYSLATLAQARKTAIRVGDTVRVTRPSVDSYYYGLGAIGKVVSVGSVGGVSDARVKFSEGPYLKSCGGQWFVPVSALVRV